MEAELKAFLADLKTLRREVNEEKGDRIAKKQIRGHAERVASTWFNSISKGLIESYTFAPELITRYSSECNHLIKLTENNNLRTSYLSVLANLIKQFRDELILPIQRNEVQRASQSRFAQFLAGL